MNTISEQLPTQEILNWIKFWMEDVRSVKHSQGLEAIFEKLASSFNEICAKKILFLKDINNCCKTWLQL